MDKIKRRDFMKMCGIIAAGPVTLLRAKVELANDFSQGTLSLIGTSDYINIDIDELDLFSEEDFTIDFHPVPRCSFHFGSQECGYRGNDIMCLRTLGDCQSKGNQQRFGGFWPIEK